MIKLFKHINLLGVCFLASIFPLFSKLLVQEKEGRAFQMLEEISVRPSVSYLVKVRNKDLEKA